MTTFPVEVGYKTNARKNSPSSMSTVTITEMTTPSTSRTTSTSKHAARQPSRPAGQVIYHVIGTTRSPFPATRGASSSATDAAVQSVPDYLNPVPMNIGLIVGVAVAIAILLCMLAYVVYKCVMAGQRPGVAGGGVDCAEKTAFGVSHDLSPRQHDHAPQFAVNGRPPPLLTNDALTLRTKKDVKEWFV